MVNHSDSIHIQDIELRGDPESGKKVTVSAKVSIDAREAASNDDVLLTVDYKLLHDSLSVVPSTIDLANVGDTLSGAAFSAFPSLPSIELLVKSTETEYSLGYSGHYFRSGRSKELRELFVSNWATKCLIGVYDHERDAPQEIVLSILVNLPQEAIHTALYDKLIDRVKDLVKTSSFYTLEALATRVSSCVQECLESFGVISDSVRVRVNKPQALTNGVATVEIVRSPEQSPLLSPTTSREKVLSMAILSIGSNIQPRFQNIEKALRLLERDKSIIRILDSSFMYDTTPMYVDEQGRFANCAILIESNLDPTGLLDHLKQLEEEVGRITTFRNGPRVVDLDIVFYDDRIMDNTDSSSGSDRGSEKGDLIIPHPRAIEREFVLRPIADMIPTFVHPELDSTITELLSRVADVKSPMRHVLPFQLGCLANASERFWTWGNQTHLMGILNATPDSFSDGGKHLNVNDALAYARTCVHEEVDVIDIGGYSTRPNAEDVCTEEEIRRVTSIIRRIRDEGITTPISVDTFRSTVARAAIESGADIINDVYALDHDPEMRNVARDLGVPVILMHSRGDAGKNKIYRGDVIDVVRDELGAKVQKALDAGLRRWNIIVDPGIGFSKTVEDNCALLREHSALTASGAPPVQRHRSLLEAWEANKKYPLKNMPTLVGSSRKSFLGKLIGGDAASVPPSERGWATAATVAASIQQGADIVRVHDVHEMRQVKIIADAIWRVARRII